MESNPLVLIYFLPLLFSIILALPFKFDERLVTRITSLCLLVPAVISFYFFIGAFGKVHLPFETDLARFTMNDHTFHIILWVNHFSLAMLTLTHILGLLVVKYSHGYLHLEKGFQRYFSTILFFIFGMYLLSMAGTMDLFFAGWEIVGLSSFLLIAFYRTHNRSVQNAWRIYNVYRICDIGLLLGAVMGHVLWHESTRFSTLASVTSAEFAGFRSWPLFVICLLVIFASLGKSAQFPFHNWPARAMEGPTPSSAIFYGALSIHAGVFLLIRTHSLWSHSLALQILVGLIGLTTMVLSSLQRRVQSNIKGQIAFASTAQIGLMFIELSLGLTTLVMVHLFFHALYRCFQLLLSPSILLNSLGHNNKVVKQRMDHQKILLDKFPTKLRNTLYVLSMSDFFMDISWRGFSFIPWKKIYRLLTNVAENPVTLLPVIGLVLIMSEDSLRLPMVFAAASFWMAIKALLAHSDPFKPMRDLAFSISFSMISVYILDHHYIHSIYSYLISVVPFLTLALFITHRFRRCDLRNFHAMGTLNPLSANLFFISFMVLAGMPISTAFLGEDMILGEVIKHSFALGGVIALSMMLNGLICVKIYVRLFMGLSPVEKSTEIIPY